MEVKSHLQKIQTLIQILSKDFPVDDEEEQQYTGFSSNEQSDKEEPDKENKPWEPRNSFLIYDDASITYKEHLILKLAYSVRHNLNNEQLDDMVKLLNVCCPIRNYCIDSTDEVTKLLLEDIDYEIWDICENCGSLFANDESLVQCPTHVCVRQMVFA